MSTITTTKSSRTCRTYPKSVNSSMQSDTSSPDSRIAFIVSGNSFSIIIMTISVCLAALRTALCIKQHLDFFSNVSQLPPASLISLYTTTRLYLTHTNYSNYMPPSTSSTLCIQSTGRDVSTMITQH